VYADMASVTAFMRDLFDDPNMGAQFAAAKIGLALTFTRRSSEHELAFAFELKERLPRVWAQFANGVIDRLRARTIANGTSHVSMAAAREPADRILERAPELTTGQIAARLRRLCLESDPEDAARRYDRAVSERRVTVEQNPSGTGNLYACDLPADRLAAIRRRSTTSPQASSLRARPAPWISSAPMSSSTSSKAPGRTPVRPVVLSTSRSILRHSPACATRRARCAARADHRRHRSSNGRRLPRRRVAVDGHRRYRRCDSQWRIAAARRRLCAATWRRDAVTVLFPAAECRPPDPISIIASHGLSHGAPGSGTSLPCAATTTRFDTCLVGATASKLKAPSPGVLPYGTPIPDAAHPEHRAPGMRQPIRRRVAETFPSGRGLVPPDGSVPPQGEGSRAGAAKLRSLVRGLVLPWKLWRCYHDHGLLSQPDRSDQLVRNTSGPAAYTSITRSSRWITSPPTIDECRPAASRTA